MCRTHQSDCFRLWERRVLLVFIYALPLNEALKNISWAILAGLYIARLFLSRQLPQNGKIGFSIILLVLAGIWSSFFAIEPAASWKGVWDIIRASAIFWMITPHLQEEQNQISLIRHILLSTALASLLAWVNYFLALFILKRDFSTVHLQIQSVGHFNQSGIYLAIISILALASMLDKRIFQRAWLGWGITVLIVFTLLGTTARSAIVVGGLGIFLILWKSKVPKWVICLLIGVVLFAGWMMDANRSFRGRIFFRGSFGSRLIIWQSGLKEVEKRAWTGVGLNNFKNIYLSEGDPRHLTIDHAHNLYLNTLVQMGWLGLIALLFFSYRSASIIWISLMKKDQFKFHVAAGAWAVVFLVGLSNTTLHHEVSILFFLILALAHNPQEKVALTQYD